jgi:hypothetical protein
VKGIAADADVQGQFAVLLTIFRSTEWREFWEPLRLSVVTFADLGLGLETPDRLVWEVCQREEIVLLTGNRNAEGPDSLEQTIRRDGRATSLPVITLADSKRLLRERSYAERAAVRILELLDAIDQYRGAGRLFVP